MRACLAMVLVLACLAVPASLSAQQPAPIGGTGQPGPAAENTTPVRDSQAVGLLQSSLAAMGGGAVGMIQNAQLKGTISPLGSSDVPNASFTWLDDFSGATLEFRKEFDAADAVRIEVSGHGSPAVQQGTAAYALRPHMTYTALPYYLPAVLLSRELANQNYSIQMSNPVTVEGKPAVQITIKSNAGPLDQYLSEQHWDLDTTTLLPVRIEYRLPSTFYPDEWVQAAVELTNYQIVNGLAVPLQVTNFQDGSATSVATVSSVAFNAGATSTAFDIPVTEGAQ